MPESHPYPGSSFTTGANNYYSGGISGGIHPCNFDPLIAGPIARTETNHPGIGSKAVDFLTSSGSKLHVFDKAVEV